MWLENNKRIDLPAIKVALDEMGWSGWLVVERSRDARDAAERPRQLRGERALSEACVSGRMSCRPDADRQRGFPWPGTWRSFQTAIIGVGSIDYVANVPGQPGRRMTVAALSHNGDGPARRAPHIERARRGRNCCYRAALDRIDRNDRLGPLPQIDVSSGGCEVACSIAQGRESEVVPVDEISTPRPLASRRASQRVSWCDPVSCGRGYGVAWRSTAPDHRAMAHADLRSG